MQNKFLDRENINYFRYFLECSYLGTKYGGWQIQNNTSSIQEIISNKISIILGTDILIYGSGRTDAGVHANGQVAHFDVEGRIINLDLLTHKLNCILPNDISIKKIYEVDKFKHARFSALSRKYIYRISQTKDPFYDHISYYFPLDLDVKLMNEACELLINQNLDCEIFSKTNSSVDHYYCNIYEANWKKVDEKLFFSIKANRFLRGMVRIIVGYMLKIGLKKIDVPIFKDVLFNKISLQRPPLAPSVGLTLDSVEYL